MERDVDLGKAVAAFGGYSAMARRCKIPLTTIHGWARRNRLPPWRIKEIERVARSEKLDIWGPVKRGARRRKAKAT